MRGVKIRRLETERHQRNAGGWARGFFVPVAGVRTCCSLVFGEELFTDCSLAQPGIGSANWHIDDPRVLGVTTNF